MVIKVNPNTIRQWSSSWLNLKRINWNMNAKKTPNAMNDWLNAPKMPQIYVGEYYLMRRGTIALYRPIQAPWQNLIMKNR